MQGSYVHCNNDSLFFFQVDKSIGRWILENVKIYNPLSGITTNQSEGFNTVLKQYQRWKEVPIDTLVHSLYRLQQYYYNEIQRGYCGLGGYQLRPEFSSLLRPSDELLLLPVSAPEEILPTYACTIPDGKCEKVVEDSLQEDPTDCTIDDSEYTILASDLSQICRAR